MWIFTMIVDAYRIKSERKNFKLHTEELEYFIEGNQFVS